MFHIVISADENYIPYTAVLLTSIVENVDASKSFKELFNAENSLLENYKKLQFDELSEEEQKEGFVFHILTDKLSEETKANLSTLEKELDTLYPCEIRLHFVDDSAYQGLNAFGKDYLIYYRLQIPSLIKEAKTCLYLDTDMLVLGDLRVLFVLDLSGAYAGVVRDMNITPSPLNTRKDYESNYFNSGFLLINCEEWKNKQVSTQIFDILHKENHLQKHDQELLNLSLDRLLHLPFAYNFIIATLKESKNNPHLSKEEIQSSSQNIQIVHYVGYKPWKRALRYGVIFYALRIFSFLPYFKQRAGIGKLHQKWWLVASKTPVFGKFLRKSKFVFK